MGGQLLLLDLIERLEDHCEIIQSNTDGILVKLRRYEDFEMLDDLCWEWEQRTGMRLEFDEFQKVYQKAVSYTHLASIPSLLRRFLRLKTDRRFFIIKSSTNSA